MRTTIKLSAAAMVGAALLLAARAPEATARPRAHAAQGAQQRTGQQIFSSTCAACHQAQGEGTDAYPPLAGSEYVNGGEQRLVRILLHGLTGEVEVQGQTYSGMMPGWGPTMSDADIAAVATHVRSSFGNKAPPVAVATVSAIRAAYPSRTTPWTVAELAKVVPAP